MFRSVRRWLLNPNQLNHNRGGLDAITQHVAFLSSPDTGALITRKDILSGLTFLRANPHILAESRAEFDQIKSKLLQLATPSKSLRVKTATVLANQVNRGYWKKSADIDAAVTELLYPLLDELVTLSGVQVSRCFRSLTACNMNEENLYFLARLIAEATRQERIHHYSAMDIAELIDSASRIRLSLQASPYGGNHAQCTTMLSDLIASLAGEFVNRRHSITLNLEKRQRNESDVLTPQALSNILYSLRMRLPYEIGRADTLHESVSKVTIEIIARGGSDEAIKACSVMHLLTFLHGCSNYESQPELQTNVLRLLLRCLVRRIDQIENTSAVHSCIDRITKKFKNPKVSRYIHSIETHLDSFS